MYHVSIERYLFFPINVERLPSSRVYTVYSSPSRALKSSKSGEGGREGGGREGGEGGREEGREGAKIGRKGGRRENVCA